MQYRDFIFPPLKNILNCSLVACCALLISSCASTMKVSEMKSSNSSFRVKSLIMHFTAVNYEDSVKYLVNEGGGVSSHYLIPMINDETYPKSELEVLKLVDENERAWHAGVSYWQGREGLNDSSIGIEIVNTPECLELDTPKGFLKPKPVCIFPDFENRQIELLIQLSKEILARNPDISPTAVIGHSDIAPSRKNDPGPRFPWQKLYENGIGAWYDTATVAKYWQTLSEKPMHIGIVQQALSTYGYKIAITGEFDRQTQDVLSAFQMHFIPWQVDSTPNNQTVATIFALIEKYFPERLESLISQYINYYENQIVASKPNQLDMTFDLHETLGEQGDIRTKFIAGVTSTSMTIKTVGIAEADIYINNQQLNLGDFFSDAEKNESHKEIFDITKRTIAGINALKVSGIKTTNNKPLNIDSTVLYNDAPNMPFIHISIPYPKITSPELASAPNYDNKIQYDFAELDEYINKRTGDDLIGASLIVLHNGKIVKQKGYGQTNNIQQADARNSQTQPINSDTIFDLNKFTQAFSTTLAVMKLYDEGRIKLSDSATKYLDEYRGNGRETITISDLLSHTSGYEGSVHFYDNDTPFGEYLYSLDPKLTKQYLLTRVPFSNSTKEYAYSDINFKILGLLVERITGMSLDTYVETHIYKPLNLNSTLYNPLNKSEFAISNQTNATDETPILQTQALYRQGVVSDNNAFYSLGGVAGHAGLFSNTQNLSVLTQLLLNRGGYGSTYLFSEATLDTFTSNNYLFPSNLMLSESDTDLHKGVLSPYASARAIGQVTTNGSIVIDPEENLAIVFLATTTNKQQLNETKENLTEIDDTNFIVLNTLIYEAILGAKAHHH